MADDADDFFPGLHFLAPQFERQLAQEQQLVLAAIQGEAAPGQVVHLFVLALSCCKQAVAAARDRLAQRGQRLFQDLGQVMAFQLAALVQELARGQVAVHDGAGAGGVAHEQHGHRRVLHHGVEQKFTLDQLQALFAQHAAQRVVGGHQVAHFVVLGPVQAE